MPKAPITREVYGIQWNADEYNDLAIEMYMVQRGGYIKRADGSKAGNGLFYHFRRLKSILWPEIVWHKWNILQTQAYLDHRIIGVLGPASSGKSHCAGTDVLADYYCFPKCTTVLVSSTTRESLENRIFGEIKKYHRMAKERFPELPGNLIEGKQRIITDSRQSTAEGRDFRNGICFPGEALVDAVDGPIRIDQIQIGQKVVNAIGIGTVTKIHQNIAPRLVRVTLSDKREIDCTSEHPIFTQRGWVKAIDLETFDMVFSKYETMSIMRQGDSQQRNILLSEMCREEEVQGLRKNYRERIPEPKVLFGEVPGLFAEKRLCSVREKVQSNQSTPGLEKFFRGKNYRKILRKIVCLSVGCFPSRMHQKDNLSVQALRKTNEICASSKKVLFFEMQAKIEEVKLQTVREGVFVHEGQAQKGIRSVLQPFVQNDYERAGNGFQAIPGIGMRIQMRPILAGCSISGHKTVGRSGWAVPPFKKAAKEGREKRQIPEGTRVESVEVLKQSGDERYSERGGGYPVFNLEVSGHPSYSVNGAIVHNCGVACRRGQNYQGLQEYVGIKNTRVRLCADELHFMAPDFVSAIANLNKNPDFKCIGLGNPKDITDALGKLCEPAAEKGGWDSGLDQAPGTKSWPIRFDNGIAIQLVGSDSPNLDGLLGIPIISQKDIDEDIKFYGKDSLQFTMMDEGMMPRGQAYKRVITRQMCLKFRAMEEPTWRDEKQTRVGFLDAAYGGVGGDRCVYGELWFGKGVNDEKQIMWLRETMLVPVSALNNEIPEDQIALFVKQQNEERGIAPNHFFFDSTGRGSLMQAFARLYSNMVGGVEFGGRPTDRPVSEMIEMTCREYYFNFVTELWFSLRLIIEGGQFRGMTEEMMQEGSMREWGKVMGNKIKVEPKDDMKKKTARSPDLVDGLCCAVEGARRLGFVIAKAADVSNLRYNDEWKKDLRERAKKLKSSYTLTYS